MLNKGLFTTETSDWATPQDLFARLNERYNFTLDVCAEEWNKKVNKYFSPEDDGLAQSWAGERCFMNPPYGREIKKWVKKAYPMIKWRFVYVTPERTKLCSVE